MVFLFNFINSLSALVEILKAESGCISSVRYCVTSLHGITLVSNFSIEMTLNKVHVLLSDYMLFFNFFLFTLVMRCNFVIWIKNNEKNEQWFVFTCISPWTSWWYMIGPECMWLHQHDGRKISYSAVQLGARIVTRMSGSWNWCYYKAEL